MNFSRKLIISIFATFISCVLIVYIFLGKKYVVKENVDCSPCPEIECPDLKCPRTECKSPEFQCPKNMFCTSNVFSESELMVDEKEEIVFLSIEKLRGGVHNDVYNDLLAFTGLTTEQLNVRLLRKKQFFFKTEHTYWNPQTAEELVWFYISSKGYLFANSIHFNTEITNFIKPGDGPVLDYSGGAGNNVIYLASNGVKCVYFGIGIIEKEFVKFRVKRKGLEHLVTFVDPYYLDEENGLILDNIQPLVEKRDELGVRFIIAADVLEHVPEYQNVARGLVSILQTGGLLFEDSPFNETGTKTSIHLKNFIPMEEALGPNMKRSTFAGIEVWEKV